MISIPTIKVLQQPTQFAWIEQTIANLPTILLDHSHCERKAASVAINLMFRYPAHKTLIKQLTAIAKEELEHFEQVNQWLENWDIPLAPLSSPPYGAKLKAQVRRQEPERLLDSLLVAALIEARSHERLGLLAQYCPDPKLAKFYKSLVNSEARHYGIYWVLAVNEFDQQIVQRRQAELSKIESDILQTLYPKPRIHS